MPKNSKHDKPNESKNNQNSHNPKTSSTYVKCSSANKQTTKVKVTASPNVREQNSPRSPLLTRAGCSPSEGGPQVKGDQTVPSATPRTNSQTDSPLENIYATPTTFFNSLTEHEDKKRRASMESLLAKEHTKSSENATSSKAMTNKADMTTSTKSLEANKGLDSSNLLTQSSTSFKNNKYSFRNQVQGHEMTFCPNKNIFVSNFDFFSAHFNRQAELGWPHNGMKISFDESLVTKYLATAQKIALRCNNVLKMQASKLNVKNKATNAKHGRSKSRVSQVSANKGKANSRSRERFSHRSSKVSTKSEKRKPKRAVRTYSNLSVDSQKIEQQLDKINQSLTQVGKSASTVSKDKFLQKVDRSSPSSSGSGAASPAIITPAEVMVHGYVFHRQVTGGSFSTLYECSSFNMPNVELACKHIRAAELQAQKDCLKDFLAEEIKILQRLNHPNIVEMYEIVSSTTDIYIFMKFADKGTIFDYLYQEWRKPLPETFAKRWMGHLMSALTYVHGLNIVHRDLKLENFLLDGKLTALLTDFGLGVCLDSPNARELLAVHCGTTDYMAPELHLAATSSVSYYDPLPADIYAMGVCLFEMVNFYRPFAMASTFASSARSVVYRQQHRQYAFNKRIFLERECRDLIDRLLEPRPSLRPMAASVLEHVWFTSQTR